MTPEPGKPHARPIRKAVAPAPLFNPRIGNELGADYPNANLITCDHVWPSGRRRLWLVQLPCA